MILCCSCIYGQDSISHVDTVIKYAVSVDTKKYCENSDYSTADCQRYIVNPEEIIEFQKQLNYFKILNEYDELLLEYLAYGYFDRKYCGKFIRYHQNGMIRIEGQYVCKGKSYKKCNLREGKWLYYNEYGTLTKIEHYKKGELISVKKV